MLNFARKLYERAMAQRPNTIEPYVKQLKKEAQKEADNSLLQCSVRLTPEARFLKEDIANALYKEGFEVVTEHYPNIGTLEFRLRWDKKEPDRPYHITY